ncbi:MAG TPA: S9 family peptidase [Gemmatimonadaceae bacterium]|nr:S9 family peptidase [Gemmatimonadaceae bacterium]
MHQSIPFMIPIAEKRPAVTTLHGETRVDDYHWLRDKDDPAVIAYLEAENAYTAAQTEHTRALRDTLYAEILGRIKETDEQVPARDHGWYYYLRTVQGLSYPIYCRKRTLDAPEQVVFDQNEEAKPYVFYQLGGMEVSTDGNFLAVLVDTDGHEDFVLRIRDLRTNEWLPDRVEELSWGLAWSSDSRIVYYVSGDAAKRPDRVWRHVVGTTKEADVQVFHEPDARCNVSIRRTRSGAYVLIQSGSYSQDEWHMLDATAPDATPRLIVARQPGVEYTVDHGDGWLYIVTNRGGATNFAVMRARPETPGVWEPFIPHRKEAFVEQVDVFRQWLVRAERREGLRRIVVRDLMSGVEHDITFDDAAYGVDIAENPEFDTNLLRFTYSSLITPPSVYDYDMATRARTLLKRQEVLGGYDPSLYAVERVMVPARDGEARIPVSIVFRKPLALDGTRPLVLYAYGSYGHTIEPEFSSARFSLIDRGVVYAIAHVRGGQEMGRAWYDDGKMMRKMNTFTDFLDAAAYLVANRYTSRDRLIAHGGSAGGLLMGAIANMAPAEFRAIVADVPFVDVINTMLDASIPLTAQEWEQWGNPADPEAYKYMRSYSPYDNVGEHAYPWMLVMSGINDSRVAFWEPAKWVAKLRAMKTDSNPLLLHMLMGAGHGGSSGRYDRLRETAFRYAFMLDAISR